MSLFLQIIYQLMAAFIVFIIGWNLIKTKKKTEIVLSLMVIVILGVRIFLIK